MKQVDANSSSMSANQKWVLASLSSGFMLENMDVMFLSFSLSAIIAQLHISSAAGGWIGTFTNLGMFVGGALFGLLGDRIGRVKTFTYTIFIFAIATGLTFFAHNITSLYILRFIAGIGAGGEYGVGIALIAENFRASQIGRMTSIAAIGGQVGSILAALLAAWVVPTWGWNTLYLFGILPVILTYFVREHVQESSSFLKAQAQAKQNQERISFGRLFATPSLSLQTLGLMWMTIVQIAGYFGLMNWLPSIVQQQHGLSVSGSSYWMIATIIGMSLGMLVFGTVLDKLSPRWAFTIFLLGSAGVMFTILNAHTMLGMLLAGACIGFFSNGMFGGYGAVISLLYPTEVRSTANNVIMNTGRAVGGFSSVVIGLLIDHYSLTVVMGFLATLYILSFLVMISLPGLRKIKS